MTLYDSYKEVPGPRYRIIRGRLSSFDMSLDQNFMLCLEIDFRHCGVRTQAFHTKV